MNCEQVREQLADYLAAALDETQTAGIQEHLGSCAWCREEALMWTRLAALEEEKPSPALQSRFDAMLAAYREGLEHPANAARERTWTAWLAHWWPEQPVFQFAIAVSCLIVGLLAGPIVFSRDAHRQELTHLRQEVQTTRELVTLSLLQQQSAAERLRGVSYSYRVEQSDPDVVSALVETVKYDPSVDVRLAALDALRRYGREPVVRKGLMEALPKQDSPLVQIALIDLLVDIHEREAVSMLRGLAQDVNANEIVRQRADRAVRQLG